MQSDFSNASSSCGKYLCNALELLRSVHAQLDLREQQGPGCAIALVADQTDLLPRIDNYLSVCVISCLDMLTDVGNNKVDDLSRYPHSGHSP